MKTVNRYVGTSFLVSVLATLAVLTFVMSVGVLFRVMDLLSRGVPWKPVLFIFLNGIPASLMFSVPVSALTSSLLVFGRLSSDGEITAMKASGINLWQIMVAPLVIAAVLSIVCVYVNTSVAPLCLHRQRTIVRDMGMETPLQLLEEGRFIQDYEGLTVYIEKKKGNRLRNIRIYDLRDPSIRREIQARRGLVHTNELGGMRIDLEDVRVDPLSADSPGPGFCDSWSINVGTEVREERTSQKRMVYMTRSELKETAANAKELYPGLGPKDIRRLKMAMKVENSKRVVLAVACFSFVLLGVPLGIRAHRKESSIGVAVSLFVVFNFYLFIIVAESLRKRPVLRPDIIVWLPVVLSVVAGVWLAHRNR